MNAPPLSVVSDPLPFAWGAAARARDGSALVVVTTDLALDARHDDPRAAFDELGDTFIGPASGGAITGLGAIAIATRVGPGFARVVEGLALREAIDLGRGWGLDEAALVERWLALQVDVIGLVAPRPSARLAHALALARGRVPIVVLDPAGRDWSPLGAASVSTLGALRAAATLPAVALGLGVPALVGTSAPALEAVRAALSAAGVDTRAPSEIAARTIAEQVHARAELGSVNDLTPAATARHLAHATSTLAEGGPVIVVDAAAAADPRAFVEGWRARRALAAQVATALVPMPTLASAKARALVGAALITGQATLAREHALALADALGLGRPASTLHVASLGAARDAARGLVRHAADRAFLGAPGLPARAATDLEQAWDAVAAALAPTDPYAARWLATAPAGLDFELVIEEGPIGPFATWSSPEAGHGRLALPARADEVPDRLPPTLFGAASAAVLALTELTRLELSGVVHAAGVTLIDARAALVTAHGA